MTTPLLRSVSSKLSTTASPPQSRRPLEVPEGKIVALVGTTAPASCAPSLAFCRPRTSPSPMARSRCAASVNGRMPHQLARAGLILVPERDKVFSTLSVQENLAFAARPGGASPSSTSTDISRACANAPPSSPAISAAARSRMLAIGMALVSANTAADRRTLARPRAYRDQGTNGAPAPDRHELNLTVLLVEQNAKAALSIADLVTSWRRPRGVRRNRVSS